MKEALRVRFVPQRCMKKYVLPKRTFVHRVRKRAFLLSLSPIGTIAKPLFSRLFLNIRRYGIAVGIPKGFDGGNLPALERRVWRLQSGPWRSRSGVAGSRGRLRAKACQKTGTEQGQQENAHPWNNRLNKALRQTGAGNERRFQRTCADRQGHTSAWQCVLRPCQRQSR